MVRLQSQVHESTYVIKYQTTINSLYTNVNFLVLLFLSSYIRCNRKAWVNGTWDLSVLSLQLPVNV